MDVAIVLVRVYGFGVVARTEEVVAEPNEIVIDPATVKSKEAHQSNHIPQLRESLERSIDNPMIINNKVQTQREEDEPMPDIPEHHPKEERKSYCREDCWVHLFVSRDAVGVGDLLCDAGVGVCVEGCWRVA